MKHALITGALGQDGQYLSELLLEKGYRVFGLVRRMGHCAVDGVEYIYGDLRDELSLRTAIRKSWPDEIYNLGGQVYVPVSWEAPADTFDVNVGGLLRILKIVEQIKRETRVYQASSSEMFGNHSGVLNELSPLSPVSPYGEAKAAAHRIAARYRERGLFVVGGILFNHESPRRGHEMVTRKIACHVAGWAVGDKSMLLLGNMDSKRDWGFAGDYVRAMHLMLQQSEPEDFVIGTGVSHSVRDFLFTACRVAGIDAEFAVNHVQQDVRLKRDAEIYDLRANAKHAKLFMGWEPKVNFQELVELMVNSEISRLARLRNETAMHWATT